MSFPLALIFAFAMGSDEEPHESFGAMAPDTAAAAPAEALPERRSFVLINTPGVLVGRIGIDFGTMVAAHVAPTGSVHGHVTYLPSGNSRESLFGLGGELGVRLYGSAWRPAGPFIGAYVIGGRYYSDVSSDFFSSDTWLATFGGAADVGWSSVSKSGFVVSIGGGVEYRLVKSESTGGRGEVANLFVSPGVRPRGLVQLGKAF